MEDPTELADAIVGHYRTGRALGTGTMANVFEAVDLHDGRKVALKVLDADLAAKSEVVARFVREARALEHLAHPNIVRVFDHGSAPTGEVWIAMELLEGRPLDGVIAEARALAPYRALRLALDVASGLSAVHAHGIVHRDLKPENVMVTVDTREARETAKLIDFGVAKVTQAELGAYSIPYTRMGSLIGSLAFAPPEQIKGQQVDARADVYAFGVMLYEMLTGELPFTGNTPAEQSKQKLSGTFKPLKRSVATPVSASLETFIRRCLAVDPLQRPADAAVLVQELMPLIDELRASVRSRALSMPPAAVAELRAGGPIGGGTYAVPSVVPSVGSSTPRRSSLRRVALVAVAVGVTVGLVLMVIVLFLRR